MTYPAPTQVTVDEVRVTFAGQPIDQIMQGEVDGFTAAQTSLSSPLNATAYLRGMPVAGIKFAWESSNPNAVKVTPTDGTGAAANVSRTVQSATDLVDHDSNGVESNGSHIGGLSTVTATALRGDGSQSGVRGTIKVVVMAAGYGGYKWFITGTPAPGTWTPRLNPVPFVPPTNLV